MNIIQSLIDEMEPNALVDDEKIYNIKDIVLHKLDENDKIVFLLYLEYGSMQKVGKKLHVSATTIYYIIRRVRETITSNLNTLNLCI